MPSPHAHLYNTQRWRALAKAFLLRNPYCAMCRADGKLVRARIVDHIRPHRGDLALFWDEANNLQGLCKLHHDSTKKRIEGSKQGAPGSDAKGLPTDPAHPWFKASRAAKRGLG